MNKHKTNRIWLALTILMLGALACQAGGNGPVVTPTPVQTEPTPVATNNNGLSPEDRANLVNATVQVLMQFKQGGKFESLSWGSGTIISADGMIVTNAHVASPASQGDLENEPDRLVIALIESEDKPPVPAYIATVKAVDGYLDLAVLQIVSTVDGSSVDTANLNLPFVELGDSTQTHVGDHVNIFGFPSIGGDTITFTDGSISGFTSEAQIGDRAWIKTDATISGGNSGGLAADDNAHIIGVPTIAASGGSGEVTDCRQIQDTNNDGVVNENDSCIPIGGFINALRPIELARPLIQAAQAGKEYSSPHHFPGQVTEAGSGEEKATNFAWLDTSNSSGEDCTLGEEIVSSYPESALCIAAVFEYSGMTNGEPVRELWYQNDGDTPDEFIYSWEYGAEGLLPTVLTRGNNPTLPPGEWYLEFYAGEDNRLIGTSDKVVVGDGSGGDETPQPSQEDTATLYGVITDADTGKPISGVHVVILDGITYKKWQSENWAEKYIVAHLQTEADGKYTIIDIPRNTIFTIVFSAEGYYDMAGDNLEFTVDAPNKFEMNIEMSK
jgi:serine protease Do